MIVIQIVYLAGVVITLIWSGRGILDGQIPTFWTAPLATGIILLMASFAWPVLLPIFLLTGKR